MIELPLSTWLQVLQLIVIAAGGMMVLAALRANVAELARRMVNVENEMKKLVEVMVTIGRQDARIDALESSLQESKAAIRQMQSDRR